MVVKEVRTKALTIRVDDDDDDAYVRTLCATTRRRNGEAELPCALLEDLLLSDHIHVADVAKLRDLGVTQILNLAAGEVLTSVSFFFLRHRHIGSED